MSGSFPYLSKLDKELQELLTNRAGNNRPVQNGGVSGLSTWVRMVSGVIPYGQTKGGLVIDSVYPVNSFANKYGNNNRPGILGYELDLKTPVRVEDARGLRPSPIITGLSINEDKYREFSFTITAYTLEQAEKLAVYFLEPGFHILAEWGWNTAQSRGQIVGGGGKIEPCDIAKYDQWPYVLSKKRKSGYTYDGLLGITTGGGMKINSDETYTLDVKTKGIGTVAEYMQTHRGGTSNKSKDSGTGVVFSPANIEEYQKKGWIGKSLFMQMVNDLPTFKQTPEVIQLIGFPKWTDEANFINMDSSVRELLLDSLNEAEKIRTEKGNIKLPKDAPLFGEERFIRFGLAIEILNKYNFNLTPQQTGLCTKKTRDLQIDISDTVIGGFPHMFSTDPTKLFIPNTTTPNFNFINALANPDDPEILKTIVDTENLNSDENLANIHPKSDRTDFELKEEKNGTAKDFATGKPRSVPYAFPCRYELNNEVKPMDKIDDTYIAPTMKPYFWGWLKDLYINFDYFISVISKPGLITRDVLYELLNGMSSACNSLWQFEITELPSETEDGDLRLTVIDKNFTGELDTNFDNEIEFIPNGTDSPFLSFDFNVNIQGAMQNSVIQKKMSRSTNGMMEHPIPAYSLIGNVFSDREDQVGTILNYYEEAEKGEDEDEERETASKTETSEENKNIVFDFITERGTLLPKIQDRNAKLDIVKQFGDIFGGNDALLEDLVFVGTWNDPKLLSHIYYIDKGLHSEIRGAQEKKDNNKQNVPLGMASAEFEVHGVSGFMPGQRMRFKQLPKKFIKDVIYQVTGIEHTIDETTWKTKIKTEMRPYGDVEDEN